MKIIVEQSGRQTTYPSFNREPRCRDSGYGGVGHLAAIGRPEVKVDADAAGICEEDQCGESGEG
jgi:hypothetical protein